MFNVLSFAIHREVVIPVRSLLHEQDVRMFGGRNVWITIVIELSESDGC